MGNDNKNNDDLIEKLSQCSYQWIKGDDVGKVEEFKSLTNFNGQDSISFSSGGRIASNLLDEFMVKVEKGFYEPAFEKSNTNNVQQRQITGKPEIHPIREIETPIAGLLKKQKENWVDVDLNLTINLPQKSLWDVIISSFDNAEEEILDYVTKDLDIEVVRESLRKSIKDIYSKSQIVKNVRTQNIVSRQQD